MDDKRDGSDSADWRQDESGKEPEPGLSLHMKLGGAGDPVEPDYSAQGQAGSGRLPDPKDEDIDSGVALHMRLGGAGDPIHPDNDPRSEGSEPGPTTVEGTRLCPGCNTITEFSAGTCPECGFQYRSGATSAPPAFEAGGGLDAPAGNQLLKIILAVAIVGVIAFGISRIDFSGGKDGQAQQPAGAGLDHPFVAIKIDDEFRHSLADTFSANADAWRTSGVQAYVYRFRVESRVEDASAQTITATAFVGGSDAEAACQAPGDKPLRNALSNYLLSYRDREGLTYDLVLQPFAQAGAVQDDDIYVRWGYEYGHEHQAEVDQVVSAINAYKDKEGQYPRTLGNVAANMKLENRGFSFIPDGWGYLPVFETDSSGNVPFGTGSSSAELYPRRITGYYLVKFLSDPQTGMDLLGDEGKSYYLNRISPLPCVQKSALHNVPVEADGEPDGIAWAVKNGELLDV